ncbi:EboA domain-containing protein [Pedobacter ghigonis]|uniref:EboA domain-containing protein n=1 Tax=Pedobacter ghigonis TaxID=2730403 RepID=UPI00158E5503|nr:EboA domain-containing protein [Pedobacter ghigonis]
MMKACDVVTANKLLLDIIKTNLSGEALNWVEAWEATPDQINGLGKAFVMAPRKTGKAIVQPSVLQLAALEDAGLANVSQWSIDRLFRVWLLGNLPATAQDKLYAAIDQLFLSAEMNEAVALYSALPFLPFPAIWAKRCAEGIRSNIGSVLEAIMENNPYPAQYLDEAAWNQLVLKAFFTEKNINLIVGLDERDNLELALTLTDYAKERWAAGRKVNPQLWRLVGKFTNEEIFEVLKTGLQHYDQVEQRAIALAVAASDYEPAKDYIDTFPELKAVLAEGSLSWDKF